MEVIARIVKYLIKFCLPAASVCFGLRLSAAPVIDPIPNASIPAGKTLIVPVTASSPNGRALTFTATSSTNRITAEIRTNNPFWKMSVAQVAPSNAPGAFLTGFRGGIATVTNLGDMTFMLFGDIAPHTVDVISGLSFAGFYNSNTIFHRVIPGFMIQGGDPNTNGTGGPVFQYDDEFHPRAIFSGSGQLALANSGKDTDGSQFFVTLGPQRFLDLGYTLFGQLLRGFEVVTNVINTPRNGNDRPLTDVIITRASLITNTTDTVITLTGTNFANVSGTIKIIADDGTAGGRVTNAFTATTASDSANDAPAILKTPVVTNLLGQPNIRLTNYIAAQDLESNLLFYDALFADAASQSNAPNSNVYSDGRIAIGPNAGYAGPISVYVYTSDDAAFGRYDEQFITFAFGDTAIKAWSSNFTASAQVVFSNQLLATFTNGAANSSVTNFTAFVNWGDNSTNAGTILTNIAGRKEVRGCHTFTNSGVYPVYVTVQSRLGAEATVVATATVPPTLKLTRQGTTNIVQWPAWASDYSLLSHTNLMTTNWVTVTNLAVVMGYYNFVTNSSAATNLFYRLRH